MTGYRALLAPGRAALVLTGLGCSFLAAFDLLIALAALPSAARDLGGIERYGVAAGAYGVAQVMTMPLGGALSDRAGLPRTLGVGMSLFAAGTIIGGAAPSIEVLALGRFVQGLGGGALLSLPAPLWHRYLPSELFPYAFAVNSSVWALAALLGPPAGSILVELGDWRWVFWINLPLMAGVLLLARVGFRAQPLSRPEPHGRPNIAGPLLLGATVACLLTLPELVLVPLIAFAITERRASQPVIPHHPSGAATTTLAAAGGLAFVGSQAFVPLDLSAGIGWSTFWSSMPLVGASAAWMLGTFVYTRSSWTLRASLAGSTALVGVATLVMALPSGYAVAVGLIAAGFGMGIASPPLFLAVLSDAPGAEGRESAAVPTGRAVGAGAGVALIGAVVIALAGETTLRAAEAGVRGLPELHDAARIGYVLLGVICLSCVPAARVVRRTVRE